MSVIPELVQPISQPLDLKAIATRRGVHYARLTLTGTHEWPWGGAAPTGRPIRMALMMFFRLENGKLAALSDVGRTILGVPTRGTFVGRRRRATNTSDTNVRLRLLDGRLVRAA